MKVARAEPALHSDLTKTRNDGNCLVNCKSEPSADSQNGEHRRGQAESSFVGLEAVSSSYHSHQICLERMRQVRLTQARQASQSEATQKKSRSVVAGKNPRSLCPRKNNPSLRSSAVHRQFATYRFLFLPIGYDTILKAGIHIKRRWEPRTRSLLRKVHASLP